MKFFIDTANIEEIKKAVDMGMVDGVTTNPSLIARENKPFQQIIKEICQVVDGPISAEVIALDAEGMVREGRELAGIHSNIVIKIPMTTEGLKAVKQLADDGIIVIPIGDMYVQELALFRKRGEELIRSDICGCRFVKLVGKYGFEELPH